jgi:hypothetical protein
VKRFEGVAAALALARVDPNRCSDTALNVFDAIPWKWTNGICFKRRDINSMKRGNDWMVRTRFRADHCQPNGDR